MIGPAGRHRLEDVYTSAGCKGVASLTAEKIVSRATIRKHSGANEIPSYRTSMVVEVPWGAHPTQLLSQYKADDAHMDEYVEASASEATFAAYLDKYVFGPKDHDAYLEMMGVVRMSRLSEVSTL